MKTFILLHISIVAGVMLNMYLLVNNVRLLKINTNTKIELEISIKTLRECFSTIKADRTYKRTYDICDLDPFEEGCPCYEFIEED